MKWLNFTSRTCSLLLLMRIATYAENPQGPFANEPDLRGVHYQPTQPFVLKETNRDRTGLAEWMLIEDWPVKIISIRVVSVPGQKYVARIDWKSKDPAILKATSEALSPSRMRRLALSDFSHFSRGGIIGGDLGVIVVEMEHRKLVIGFCPDCFYFGISHGTDLQAFESWLLAKQLDDILRDQTGRGLDPNVFARLSGEQNLDEQREIYSKNQKK